MPKPMTIAMAWAACLVLTSPAFAQNAGPVIPRDVTGQWRLVVTPAAEDQGRTITFKSRDGRQRLEFPLIVTARPDGRLVCVADGHPADCRIRGGDFVVVSNEGGVRMTFTLTGRTRGGFSGSASLRVPLLPIGGPIGSVTMDRQ